MVTFVEALKVVCPLCGQPAGKGCIGMGYRRVNQPLSTLHNERLRAADALPKIDQDILAIKFKETCAAAQERSKTYACSCHVLARVALLNGHPVIHGFCVDDFSDGSVLITYSKGEVWTSHTI